jgi:16S rRNA (guanine527-N7)-methyltransferase
MFRELLAKEFDPYGALTTEQLDQLENHYTLLQRWNPRLNLTRIDSVEAAVRLHYCESLFAGRSLPPGPLSIVDVGSGAGFPGIPVGILRPECSVTLVEAHQRKAVFLREASRNLSNIRVVTDRAENLQAGYDWLISRAVSPVDVLKLKLANNLALLVGGEAIQSFDRRVSVPWGTDRFLGFHVEPSC